MAIRVLHALDRLHETKKREVIHNTARFHTWLHCYPDPGDKDDMHCHNGDQTFFCLEGECTMHFPDGGKSVLKPGMIALIHGGDFYQLENTGDGPMYLIGHRSGKSEDVKHINYELRKDIKELSPEERDRIRSGGSVYPSS